jgi:hypothetical protein
MEMFLRELLGQIYGFMAHLGLVIHVLQTSIAAHSIMRHGGDAGEISRIGMFVFQWAILDMASLWISLTKWDSRRELSFDMKASRRLPLN